MFRSIDIDVMNVIDSKILARDAGGKPVPTFPHPARALGEEKRLERRPFKLNRTYALGS
jgi:hypothetical protein